MALMVVVVLVAAGSLLATNSETLASNLTNNPPEYDQAISDYKAKKYSAALVQLKKLHETGKCNDMAHYFMALCYQGLNQISCAKSEYLSVSKSKNPSLRLYSERALASIERWSQHRLYEGNGNYFDKYSSSPRRISSSGAAGKDQPISEINIQMPPPTGGC